MYKEYYMERNEIHSYTIDEFRTQIKRFFFSCIGEITAGKIELLNDGINIKYGHNDSCDWEDLNYIKYPFTMDNWNKFVEKIFNINIHKWNKNYRPKIFGTCGVNWLVEIEFKNFNKIECSGYNEYPYNWEKFQKIIREFFPQMEY